MSAHFSSRRVIVATGIAVLLVLAFAAPALASARWQLSSRAAPTNLPPGGEGLINIAANDLGTVGVTGAVTPVTITDTLPSGLKVTDANAVDPHLARSQSLEEKEETWKCSVADERIVTCSTSLAVPPYERLEVEIPVKVVEPSGTEARLSNQVTVHGGEAAGGGVVAGASLARDVRISEAPVTFGLEDDGYAITAENEDGSSDTQAGSHPYQLTSTLDLNQTLEEIQSPGQPQRLAPSAPALAKNLTFDLPPGLLGNVTAAGQCSDADFSALAGTAGGVRNLCPADSAIGVAVVTILAPSPVGYKTIAVPLFNLEPAFGEPARFGFETEAVPVVVDLTVRTDGDYGVSATVTNATAAAQVLGTEVIIWGSPSAASHDNARGWGCLREGRLKFAGETCAPPEPRSVVPFLSLPTSCSGGLGTTLNGSSWTGEQLAGSASFPGGLEEPLASLMGCSALPFSLSLAALPVQPAEDGHAEEQTTSASTPTGISVDVRVDQKDTLTEDTLGDADVRSAKVTLPVGMELSPSAANGLEACTEAQVGYIGGTAADPLAEGAAEPLRFNAEPAKCPTGSKLGLVRVKTPLLGEELTGSVYLAQQDVNPFGSLVALYVVAESEKLGLRVKLAGEGQLNEANGQITTTFTSTPQVPFEDLNVTFFGGARGPLSTPALCGEYAATSSFESWAGAQVSPASAPFTITSGPGGSPCPATQPFAPSFAAGSASVQAGAFTSFTVSISNPDGDQGLRGLQVQLPPGIAAMLSTVAPCSEPPAGREWSCGPDSLIGHSVARAGLGDRPYALPGSVYLTVGYDGAPFGILVVTPAVAGPFNLGDVDVRSKINVDQNTAAVTIASDPFPLFVKGVPAQLKQIEVTVDRPGFEFNPTSCDPMSIGATLTGALGTTAPGSSHFQVAGCEALPFRPTLTASTEGKTSKVDGASLTVKVTSSPGQANIAKTVVTLPKALPSRLSTLQLACVAKTFQENPASCPEGSFIGTATVHTPVLKSPLSGPAILVSHGGESFPDVEFLLQGEGIELVLDGKTHIKDGITTSSFNTVPDAPVTSFETVLPEGPHSILGAISDLCTSKLVMPTVMTGQNGAVIEKDTPIAVSGCSGVKGSTSRKLSQAQKRSKALTACRKRYAHKPAKRASCERAAKHRYPTKTRKK